MGTATQPTVTAIRVTTNCDSLYDGNMITAELAAIDQEATSRKYRDLLSLAIAEDYPEARITVTDATVYRTEVSIDTDMDSSRGEEAEELAWEAQEVVALAVDEAGARVWEAGDFWILKEIDSAQG